MPTALENLNRALAAGDLGTVRTSLATLDEKERELLEAEFGPLGFRRLQRAARGRRRANLGRVIVVNGIMGALLDVTKGDDVDRVWINFWKIIGGRFRDLKLELDGSPADPRVQVAAAALHKTYLPMLLELDNRWDVRAFPFDWRVDMDRSADQLAEVVRSWGSNEPVHIVAHSMGGLVSRRMIYKYPDLWERMDDPLGHQRGGRLIMLGTPNHGSYIIPLVLTGEEKVIRMLAMIDLRHSRERLLKISGTFAGSYQMMPSPFIDVDDDHADLFEAATWGTQPVHRPLIDKGLAFATDLVSVVDPERFIYVAGYDQRTPYRIRIDGPGKFKYQYTQDGDGRVPHVFGLLDGVKTYWVDEAHGDLPKNDNILDGIHMLLSSGATDSLEARRPERRGVTAPTEWLAPADADPVPEEFKRLAPKRGQKEPTDQERIELETTLLGDYIGRPATRGGGDGRVADGLGIPRGPVDIHLDIEVVWGDIRSVKGDVYCVGHYQNVLPQNAEWALDLMISGCKPDAPDDDFVLRDLTRRGVLIGALGDVNFYPWARQTGVPPGRLVAVAGMGHAGEFDELKLRRLARTLVTAVAALPDAKTVSSVLIGSGEGGLPIHKSLQNTMLGLADALADDSGTGSSIKKLRIVEYNYSRANQILEALKKLQEDETGFRLERLAPDVVDGPGGLIDTPYGLALTLAAAADAFHRRADSAAHRKVRDVLEHGLSSERREAAEGALEKLKDVEKIGVDQLAGSLHVECAGPRGQADDRQPTRISYTAHDRGVSVSAITNSATVPVRELRSDFELVHEIIERATDPDPLEAPDIAELLEMLLVPSDFRGLLSGPQPLIFEVDRDMAAVHWEFLPGERAMIEGIFASLQRPVARQLRTRYSPPPLPVRRSGQSLRALVIGDPGDPEEDDQLLGARREARAVAKRLRAHGCEVSEFIGAPIRRGRGPVRGVPPASRLDVLKQLVRGEYDLVHYCGHADFDPDDPSQVGWLFKGGLITPAEIENMERAPRLIVANACLSGRMSATFSDGGFDEHTLLPSLADEFFHRGVRNYVGTAWEVNDEGAVLFATTLYDTLFANGAASPGRLGDAVLAARKALYREQDAYECLWAAYQHYGDPQLEL